MSANQAVVTHIEQPQSDATALIQAIERAAINPAVDVDKMERLFALQERMMARNAETAFNEAMRLTQQEMPKIKRNKKNNQTGSLYADLEAVTDAAVPIYTKHGFALSFGQDDCPVEGKMRIVCWCSNAGYTRKYHYDASLDMTGMKGTANKTPIQGEGSTFSYGQRYLTKLIFNITLTDEDNDGNGSEQVEQIDMAAVQKFVSRFTDAFDADVAEPEKAALVHAVHHDLAGKNEIYIAVGNLLGTKRKNAIRAYVEQHKQLAKQMKGNMR